MSNLRPGNLRLLNNWIAEMRLSGGVDDCVQETVKAINSAAALCRSVVNEGSVRCGSEMAQLSVRYLSAYMVSCAKHGSGDIVLLCCPSDQLQSVFRAESHRNTGFLHTLLAGASDVNERKLASALFAAGVYLTANPMGRGEGADRLK